MSEIGQHLFTNAARVFLKLLVANDLQHRDADRARYGVSAERAEKLHSVVERLRDRARCRHGANRVTVAERLPHDHDVRHDALVLERPEARAHPAEARLYLI